MAGSRLVGAPEPSRRICHGSPSNTHQRILVTPLSLACWKASLSAVWLAEDVTPWLPVPPPKSAAQLSQGTFAPCRYQSRPRYLIREPAVSASVDASGPRAGRASTADWETIGARMSSPTTSASTLRATAGRMTVLSDAATKLGRVIERLPRADEGNRCRTHFHERGAGWLRDAPGRSTGPVAADSVRGCDRAKPLRGVHFL